MGVIVISRVFLGFWGRGEFIVGGSVIIGVLFKIGFEY